MIVRMKKYSFLVFHQDYDVFLSALREVGVVHITQHDLSPEESPDLQAKIALRKRIKDTLEQAAPYSVESAAESTLKIDEIEPRLDQFQQLLSETKSLAERMRLLAEEKQRMAIWGRFSRTKLDELQAMGYAMHFFSCAASKFTDSMGYEVARLGDKVYFVQVGDRIPLEVEATEYTLNKKSCDELQTEWEVVNGLKVAADARLQAWSMQNVLPLNQAILDLNAQIDWTRVELNTSTQAAGTLKVLEGFCPIDKVVSLEHMLTEAEVFYQASDPTEDDNTPIQLKNNWFSRMFEVLTGMYGWPAYGEFDPTPILAPFFLLFFALCMGDAGYGLVLIIVGQLIRTGKLKIQMFEGLGPIITALGVGTLVIGFFMGGFFGINLYEASWVPDSLKSVMLNSLGMNGKIAGYDVMMVLALGIGVFHICLAMIVKAIGYTMRFGFKENVSTWGWLILILGGLLTLVLASLKVFSADATKIVLIVVGALSALGIFIFNKPGRNPLINIGAGLWDTYQMATGILGDVLSYIRLYALGLAGGMLGKAFNDVALMVLGDGEGSVAAMAGKWTAFLLIVLFGHVLNLLMSCLGAFVHPLRLSFVEYFKNAGYEGTGTRYQPFKKIEK